MEQNIPKTCKSQKNIHRPCWWNKNTEKKKHYLNQCQKTYRGRSTPTNLTNLIEAENQYAKAKDEAVDEWSKHICQKLNESRSLKVKWSKFRKLTKQNNDNLVLPFTQDNGQILFDDEDKGRELEKHFSSK